MNSSAEMDPLAHITNELDDLGNFLEFDNMDLNNLDASGPFGDPLQQQDVTQPSPPFQDFSGAPTLSSTSAHDFGGHDAFAMQNNMVQRQYMSQHNKHAPTANPYVTESMYQPSMHQPYNPSAQNFQYHPHQGFPPHMPPTPNSYEMHGQPGGFMQQHPQLDPQQRAIMEQRYHTRKDDAIAFTPMVSPAGTPQYNMLPEFTTPGAYFSPLTSPMLRARNDQQTQMPQHQQSQQGYLTNPSTAPSSNTNSPIDPNFDVDTLSNVMSLPGSVGPQPRKSRRRVATAKAVSAGTRANQTQTQKTQKRKATGLTLTSNDVGPSSFSERATRSQNGSASVLMPVQLDSSEAESISPEPLSESLMGPPPRPGSALNPSPTLNAQQQEVSNAVGSAATPKSLLTTRSNHQPMFGQQVRTENPSQLTREFGGIDDLELPEAATKRTSRRPSISQINTQLASSEPDDTTPRLSARKTPKLGPLSTPSSARPGSALQSPSMVGSPMTASTPGMILKDKGSKSNKKRGSLSANGSKLVSPALVPKVSPSIKPLLPEGTPLNSATQAMLLASKSNYQNILEGNHLPGVSYPDSLSTGLTSKRTSHKVAEQGRRNRINEALKEMQCLIPRSNIFKSPINGEVEHGSGGSPEVDDDDRVAEGASKEERAQAAVKSNNSKAATVELANEYIRRMQRESANQSADLLQLRRENEELRKRLAGSSPADSSERSASIASPTAAVKVQ